MATIIVVICIIIGLAIGFLSLYLDRKRKARDRNKRIAREMIAKGYCTDKNLYEKVCKNLYEKAGSDQEANQLYFQLQRISHP